jgi:hypothetical protein
MPTDEHAEHAERSTRGLVANRHRTPNVIGARRLAGFGPNILLLRLASIRPQKLRFAFWQDEIPSYRALSPGCASPIVK